MAHPAIAIEAAIQVLADHLPSLSRPASEEYARGLVAVLANHDPPLLICFPDEIKEDDGDPAGTPAVTDLSIRTMTFTKLVQDGENWLDDRDSRFVGPLDRVAVVDSHSTCGPAGRQTFRAVAIVLELDSPNPGLAIHGLSTVSLAEKVVTFVKTRPWEDKS